MVQKIYPRVVIWGAFFPPPVVIFSKKSAECSVYLYSSPWLILCTASKCQIHHLTAETFSCNNNGKLTNPRNGYVYNDKNWIVFSIHIHLRGVFSNNFFLQSLLHLAWLEKSAVNSCTLHKYKFDCGIFSKRNE